MMKTFSKKGDVVLKQVVYITIAVIMIFVVSAFGAKIWGAIFPSGDKTTIKSFDAFYYLLNAKTMTNLDFESDSASLYLRKGYCIILFDTPTISEGIYQSGGDVYHAPDECKGEQCICLYDGKPVSGEEKKNKDVISCNQFTGQLNVDNSQDGKYNILSKKLCSESGERFISIILAKTKVADKSFVYIMDDNPDNDAIIAELSAPICIDDAASICNGKKNGSIVSPTDEEGLIKIQQYCASDPNAPLKATSVRCVYREDRTCKVDCSVGDVSSLCATGLKTCNDFNTAKGITPYMSAYKDYEYYFMCKNDKDFCNIGCGPLPLGVYNSDADDGKVPPFSILGHLEGYPEIDRQAVIDCDMKFLQEPSTNRQYLTSYDDTKDTCKTLISKYFETEKRPFYICKNYIAACTEFVRTKADECKIKYSASGVHSWLTSYDPANSDCDSKVKELFEEMTVCSDIMATP